MARRGRARGVIWVRAVAGLVALALVLSTPSGPASADHDGDPHNDGHGHHGGGGKGESPTAVAMDSHGRVYVGFASSGNLMRINRGGKALKKPFSVPNPAPVTALSIARYDRVWVDNGRTAVLIRRDGSHATTITHGPETCPDKAAAGEYGGITSVGRKVFIANRCERTVEIYRWHGKRVDEPVAVLELKGKGFPRGIDQEGGRLYVTMPDRGVVLVFDTSKLRAGDKPVRTVKVPKPRGGKKPQPSGVVVDKFGQLLVTDRANNALYFLDGRNNFKLYRTLGHPPRAGKKGGALAAPVGLAQHRQDGSRQAGALVIAEQRNRRVQRWNTYGYTYWVTRTKSS